MRAVVMTAPAADGSTTSVADIDEPEPGPGQVAIDVAFAGVNFIDVMARRGDPGYASGWPYVPGLEVAGTIRSVGAGVHDLHPGERVAAFTPGGGMAEVAVAAAGVTVEVPPDVPLGIAASAPLVVSTALLLLTDLSIAAPGGRVVLFGNAAGGAQAPLPPAGRLIGGNAGVLGFSMSRLSATAPETVARALATGLEMMAAAQIRPELTMVEPLDSVAAIHDLLAAGRGTGKYVARVNG